MNINKEITELKNDLYDSHKDAWLKAVTDLQNQMEQLKHDNEILREAVEFYGNEDNYYTCHREVVKINSVVSDGCGNLARQALEKIKDDSLIKR